MPDLILGPVIVTKYCCATNSKGSRILATHKRDNDTTWRCYRDIDNALSNEENHLEAAEKLLARWPYENTLKIVGRGHDANNYYFLCSTVTP